MLEVLLKLFELPKFESDGAKKLSWYTKNSIFTTKSYITKRNLKGRFNKKKKKIMNLYGHI